MTEDYRATPRQWADAEYYGNPDRQPCPIGAYACILELRARVETLEAAQQPRTFTADEVAPTVAPTTRLHSYKIGEAEPVEDWGKGHRLVNPEPSAGEHPITPPPELVNELQDLGNFDAITLAYQAGADQELEACCEWLERNYNYPRVDHPLRAARRTKPPSLKELALAIVTRGNQVLASEEQKLLRRALEALDD